MGRRIERLIQAVFKFRQSAPAAGQRYSALSQSGNIFFTMFGAVALVGAVGAASMQVMKGPVRTMSEVTKRTVAENNMIASSKLAVMAAANQAGGGDCDSDGIIEPVPFVTGGGCTSSPTGGGCLPTTIGAAMSDPWDTTFGYCVWDHGDSGGGNNDGSCGGSSDYQAGQDVNPGDNPTKPVVAIISAGPDRIFQTSCDAGGDYTKPGTSDDLVLVYTYGEAVANSGGLWDLKTGDPDTAEINKNLSVKDASNVEQLSFDTATKAFALGAGGSGAFPLVKADNLQSYTANGPITTASNIALATQYLSGDGGDEGISIDASGNVTASGTFTSGAATVDSLNAGSGAVTTTGTVTGGALTTSGTLNAGTSTLGATGVDSLNAGSGTIQTTGAVNGGTVTASGLLTGGTLSAGASTLGATGVASLDAGSGTIQTTGSLSAGASSLGATSITGTLGVSGLATLDALGVTNAASVGGTLAVTGLSTLSAASITGDLTVGDTLDMTTGKITNLASPTANSDAANKAYVDSAITAGVPGAETDPQVDDITTAGKWCRTDGSAIQCDQNQPIADNITDADGDTMVEVEASADEDKIRFSTGLSDVKTERMIIDNEAVKITSTPIRIVSITGAAAPVIGGGAADTLSGLTCADGQVVKWNQGTSLWVCYTLPDGADNLGNHDAEEDLNMAGFKVTSTVAIKFNGVAGNAPTK